MAQASTTDSTLDGTSSYSLLVKESRARSVEPTARQAVTVACVIPYLSACSQSKLYECRCVMQQLQQQYTTWVYAYPVHHTNSMQLQHHYHQTAANLLTPSQSLAHRLSQSCSMIVLCKSRCNRTGSIDARLSITKHWHCSTVQMQVLQ